ncbi:MAG: hypothetical protein HKN46_08775, partial [Acidimicrobiia bacterium]|nr:hypothetical protein [Acidimicrobiia bacterium]
MTISLVARVVKPAVRYRMAHRPEPVEDDEATLQLAREALDEIGGRMVHPPG